MTTTPQTEAEQDVPLPDGFIMDGLPDGRIEYKRGFLRESDSLLRSCAPAWEARSIYRLHRELRRLDAAHTVAVELAAQYAAERDQLREQLAESQSEREEQARLLGMSAERELSLRAQVEQAKLERDEAQAKCQEAFAQLDEAGKNEDAWRAQVERLRGGEAVGEVFTMEALGTPGRPFCHVQLNRILPTGTKLYTAQPAAPAMVPLNRDAFEQWFAWSRKSKGEKRKPTFEQFDDGTYKDEHTQRHWWTWQNAIKTHGIGKDGGEGKV